MFIKIPLTALATFLLLLLFTIASSTPSHESPNAETIGKIIVLGNKVTKTKVILHLFGVDSGSVFDSLAMEAGKKRLLATRLFKKVDLFTLMQPAGRQIYVVVAEKIYLLPYDYGGELYGRRYGKEKKWWRLRFGIEYGNLRGLGEIFRTSFSFWDWHSLGCSWYKPLLPTPYYISIGASADQIPDETFRIDHSIVRGKVMFGRKISLNSRVGTSILQLYRRRIYADSLFIIHDTVHVHETFNLVSWLTDDRNNRYDPSRGFMVSLILLSNALHSGTAPTYAQLNTDLRYYHTGFAPNHKIALRLRTNLRSNNAGVTHRLQLGGEGSIRGYSRGQFGLRFVANNSLTTSLEYRFPLFSVPAMDLLFFNKINTVFSAISYHVDGAFILDYGRVSAALGELFEPFSPHIEQGTGVGAGIRIITPTFERSVCFDVVWGTYPWGPSGYTTFMEQPALHFYLDMYF